ncbi:MAG: restriction endonuclease subunit S [Gammaproteobacteria bacterium]
MDELGFVGRGKSKHRPRNDPSLYDGPYPFIQTADIMAADPYITTYSQTYSEIGLRQSKMWPPNTLCMTIAGANTAKVAILKIQACFPDSVIGFIPDKSKADLHFVMYSLGLMKDQFLAVSRGATQDNLGLNKLLSFPLLVPDVREQQRIAGILSTYDELIENNKRRIALLEKMAEEIYREWFVRMRFPGHEKTKFVKGVPEGWRIAELQEIISFTMGQSPKSEFYNEVGKGLPFNQGVGTYGERFPRRVTYCDAKGRKARKGDILFSVRAPVGRINIADSEMIIGRGLAALRHRHGQNSYLFYSLKTTFSSEDIIGNGSIFNSVGKDELARCKVYQPPQDLVMKFDELASGMDEQVSLLAKCLENLTATRNALLPRLISGKLSVEDLDIQYPPSMREEAEMEALKRKPVEA